MKILVMGGSGSGKSEFAENICDQCLMRRMTGDQADKIYLATMAVNDSESQARVLKHRRNRSGKSFLTAELPVHPQEVEAKPEDLVLLECLSNLAANTMFLDSAKPLNAGGCLERLKTEMSALGEKVTDLVVVTNQVFSDGVDYDPYSKAYVDVIAGLNRFLAEDFDAVYEVVCGIPVAVKGSI